MEGTKLPSTTTTTTYYLVGFIFPDTILFEISTKIQFRKLPLCYRYLANFKGDISIFAPAI